jgi:hypothetical protein
MMEELVSILCVSVWVTSRYIYTQGNSIGRVSLPSLPLTRHSLETRYQSSSVTVPVCRGSVVAARHCFRSHSWQGLEAEIEFGEVISRFRQWRVAIANYAGIDAKEYGNTGSPNGNHKSLNGHLEGA